MKRLVSLFAIWMLPVLASSALAAQQDEILGELTREAASVQSGFVPSAARGGQFYQAKHTGGREADSCAVCHTQDAKNRGQHARTHKIIEPLAPVANRERFTDPAKVEKWFKRNCKEVLGRVCTPQEKADFTAYILSLK